MDRWLMDEQKALFEKKNAAKYNVDPLLFSGSWRVQIVTCFDFHGMKLEHDGAKLLRTTSVERCCFRCYYSPKVPSQNSAGH